MASPAWLAPCIPHWLTVEREAEMQVNDYIRKSVAFLGQPCGDRFFATGTGFFVWLNVEGYDFRYLITARHIVWPGRPMGFNPMPPDGEIFIRINRKAGTPKELRTNIKDWIFPQNIKQIDICAYRFSDHEHDSNNDLDFGVLNLQTMALVRVEDDFSKFGIYTKIDTSFLAGEPHASRAPVSTLIREIHLGDEIFMTGAFISHIGRKNNIPIIRVGTISAMPEESVQWFSETKPAYLIETRSLGGLIPSPSERGSRRGFARRG